MTETLVVQRTGTIATVVLNRPEKLNALTKSMWQQLGQEVETLSADPDVRCIVLRGAGDKSFAPGNDISEFENERANVTQARAYGAIMRQTIEALERSLRTVTCVSVVNQAVLVFLLIVWAW